MISRATAASSKGNVVSADNLAGFMAFAGDDENIAAAQFGDSRRDRLAAVADLDRVRRRGEDRAADLRGRARCADCRR